MQIGGFNNINSNMNHIEQNKKDTDSVLGKIAAARALDMSDSASRTIADSLGSQISSLSQGVNNANDGIALLQIADSVVMGLSENADKLNAMSVRANNDALSADQKSMLQSQANAIKESMSQSVSEASFNGKEIFGSNFSFLAGLNTVDVAVESINVDGLDIENQTSIQDFQDSLTRMSSDIGSATNALASSVRSTLETVNDLSNSKEMLEDSRVDTKVNDYQQNSTKLSASILAAAHSNDALARNINALLQ